MIRFKTLTYREEILIRSKIKLLWVEYDCSFFISLRLTAAWQYSHNHVQAWTHQLGNFLEIILGSFNAVRFRSSSETKKWITTICRVFFEKKRPSFDIAARRRNWLSTVYQWQIRFCHSGTENAIVCTHNRPFYAPLYSQNDCEFPWFLESRVVINNNIVLMAYFCHFHDSSKIRFLWTTMKIHEIRSCSFYYNCLVVILLSVCPYLTVCIAHTTYPHLINKHKNYDDVKRPRLNNQSFQGGVR